MYNFDEIKEIHIEITSKCQARCPMCPRRVSGGILNPLITLTEVDLDTFKTWFDPHLIGQLKSFIFCGNLGDPIVAQDCLEILEYVRESNPNIYLSMHTNGSARTTKWWSRLAKTDTHVVFGIDGLADTHKLYRVDTDWNKIIENATAFIQAGGTAEWHMLAFKHNEHQIEECEQLSKKIGFTHFAVKHTSRFTEPDMHVIDDLGFTTHVLHPTQKSLDMIPKAKEAQCEQLPIIHCKARKYNQLYISADGTVGPCCWLDFSWVLPKQNTRIDYMDRIGVFPNLNRNSLKEIFDSGYFRKIEETWKNNPLKECAKQCGTFDMLGEQFNEA